MEKPRKLDFDISIITKEELSKDEIKMFLMVVRDSGPNGIISPYTRTYSDGAKANIFITMSVLEDGYKYQVPLKRNLTGDEAEAIVAEWVEEYDGDFDLEASSPILRMQDLSIFDKVEVDEDYEHIAFNVERNIQHQRWIDSMVSEGWRYGMKHSDEDRVSPLLRPWEQLSEKHQQVCIEKNFDNSSN